MIEVGGRQLVNASALAECFRESQEVLDLLGRAAEQGRVEAYDHAGGALTRLTDGKSYADFCVGLNDLRRYFSQNEEDSEIADRIEGILAQFY
jgi:hypothetical protein